MKLEVCSNRFFKQAYLITLEHLKLVHTQVAYQKILSLKENNYNALCLHALGRDRAQECIFLIALDEFNTNNCSVIIQPPKLLLVFFIYELELCLNRLTCPL